MYGEWIKDANIREESIDVKHWVKQVMVLVLFSNNFVKVLNVDEYKLDFNINNNNKVDVIIEKSASALLFHIVKSWWEPIINDSELVWITSFENLENNKTYMLSSIDGTLLSSIEDTYNGFLKSFVRESLTTSKLSTFFLY